MLHSGLPFSQILLTTHLTNALDNWPPRPMLTYLASADSLVGAIGAHTAIQVTCTWDTPTGSEVVCSRVTRVTEASGHQGTALTVTSHTVTVSSAQRVTGAGLEEERGGTGEKDAGIFITVVTMLIPTLCAVFCKFNHNVYAWSSSTKTSYRWEHRTTSHSHKWLNLPDIQWLHCTQSSCWYTGHRSSLQHSLDSYTAHLCCHTGCQ